MIFFRQYRGTAKPESIDGFRAFVESVAPPFKPLIMSGLRVQSEMLQADPLRLRARTQRSDFYFTDAGPTFEIGEAFTDGSSLFCLGIQASSSAGLQLVQREDGSVERIRPNDEEQRIICAYVGPEIESDAYRGFRDLVSDFFRIELQPFYYPSRRFRELRAEADVGPVSAPDAAELKAARALADAATRKLAVAIKASGGLLVSDLPAQIPSDQERAGDIRKTLEEAGLITGDIVVICKQTDTQVNRVPSEETLKRLSREGLRCACGRSIGEERIEEALSITESGRRLLDSSRWMHLLLVSELLDLGIPRDGILLEQQIGGDEIDCFAEISGELAFFELKDKTFSLGNAYSFGAKLGLVQAEHPLIITTEYVGNDAKEHFERAAAAAGPRSRGRAGASSSVDNLRYIEGIGNLPEGLENLVGAVYTKDAASLVSAIFASGSLDARAVVAALADRDPGEDTEEDSAAKAG